MSVFKVVPIALSVSSYKAYNPVEEKEVYNGELRVAAAVSIQVPVKTITVVIKAEGYVKTGKGAQVILVGYIETTAVFSVEAEWKRMKTVKKQLVAEIALENALIGLAYDSTRGLLLERGRSDLMGQIILPVIDPATILREVTQQE